MANSTVPDTIQAEINQLLHGRFLQNVWNFRDLAPPITVTRLSTLAATLADWLANIYAPLFSEDLTFVGVVLTSLDFDDPYEFALAISTPGEVASPANAVNVAAATTLITGLIGRSFKGRSFASGLAKISTEGNAFDPVLITDLNDSFTALRTTLALDDFEHVVVSRQRNMLQLDPAVATTITTTSTSVAVHDMGRRLDNG